MLAEAPVFSSVQLLHMAEAPVCTWTPTADASYTATYYTRIRPPLSREENLATPRSS